MQSTSKPIASEQMVQRAWQDPLACAAAVAYQDCCFLHTSLPNEQTGRYSYLCIQPEESIEANTLDALDRIAPNEQWFGYLAYELGQDIEALPSTRPNTLPTPRLRLVRYAHLYRFDHQSQTVEANADAPPLQTATPDKTQAKIHTLSSNMDKARYLECVERTKAHIHEGAFYQANITRKFYGTWSNANPFDLYARLCAASPAPYSAFVRHGEHCILSSSPEQFLSVNAQRQLSSRPIKGTLRGEDARELLSQSAKDKAENLMIVDLMRNDFSRVCEKGSVHVSDLYNIQSYQTLHHMVSTVTGKLHPTTSTADILRATFPPGSMTGAPKIAAMRWCAEQEQMDRGIYSGAIGRIDGTGTFDLSVVIRTLVCDSERFEFQVGGGIVADSDPLAEWQETLTKARGICAALGITTDQLAAL